MKLPAHEYQQCPFSLSAKAQILERNKLKTKRLYK